ncbi:hypothetical protein FOYG_05466 [Fusarium oxysporum NRRL 32931]|uniref:Uncharacterized protein n=1 Tax=Fusarium oxysporum NRRL 32931 TaxID=660029 RepID=W9IWT3_FUSOX|nr:hypothetical protein FOYG_05466 [Fusarium oxysporum NRRL 32931]
MNPRYSLSTELLFKKCKCCIRTSYARNIYHCLFLILTREITSLWQDLTFIPRQPKTEHHEFSIKLATTHWPPLTSSINSILKPHPKLYDFKTIFRFRVGFTQYASGPHHTGDFFMWVIELGPVRAAK